MPSCAPARPSRAVARLTQWAEPAPRRHACQRPPPKINSLVPSALLGLSAREREVLQQMATGRNNHTIAKTLYMSDRAVEKQIGSMFQKLGFAEEREVNRRIMAVLAFLEATGPARSHNC